MLFPAHSNVPRSPFKTTVLLWSSYESEVCPDSPGVFFFGRVIINLVNTLIWFCSASVVILSLSCFSLQGEKKELTFSLPDMLSEILTPFTVTVRQVRGTIGEGNRSIVWSSVLRIASKSMSSVGFSHVLWTTDV